MARQYSVLNRKTTLLAVFFMGLSLGLLALIPPLHAQDDPYTVSGVRVDATAASAVDARKQAFEQAQQAAFSLLASRFLSPEQMKTYQAPPAAQITPLVDDFEITNEKLSPTRYVGTYTFRFRHAAAQNLINARGEAANAAASSQYTGMPPGGIPAGHANAPANYDGVYSPYHASQPSYPVATSEPVQAPGNALRVRVHFNSLGEWTMTQKALRGVAGVVELRTLSLTPAEALVELRYQGTEVALRQALGLQGMTLNQSGGNVTPQVYNPYAAALNATSLNAHGPGGGDAVYDLSVSAVPASPVLPIAATPPVSAYR